MNITNFTRRSGRRLSTVEHASAAATAVPCTIQGRPHGACKDRRNKVSQRGSKRPRQDKGGGVMTLSAS